MLPLKLESDPDDTISREAEQYAAADTMDTPTFLQSLDMPVNDSTDLLVDPVTDGSNGMAHFGFSPSFGSFEYPDERSLDNPLNGDSLTNLGNVSTNSLTGGLSGTLDNSSGDVGVGINGNANSISDISGNTSSHNTSSGNMTLTKLSKLSPLPQLSDPAINNLQMSAPSLLSGYIHNGLGGLLLATSKKKKAPVVSKQPPAFIQKMWLMVNDPENHQYIRWSNDGESFLVAHREEFMKSILPKYFKHNNFASFVRQLNMYGWHKVQDITSGLLRDDRNPEEVLQFKNALFLRGREDLLDSIVRNKSAATEADSVDTNQLNLQLVVNELELIKMNQLAIIEDMRRMRKDNQMLWNESFTARERHLKQTETLEKIMKFLAAVYGNSAGKVFEVEDDRFDQDFDKQVSAYASTKTTGEALNSTTNYSQLQFQKPRLMLMNKAYQQLPEEIKRPESVNSKSTSNRISSVDSPAVQTPSDTNSPHNASDGADPDNEKTPVGNSGSLSKDTAEDITGTPSDLSQSDANKVFQQIMNQDRSGVSPNQMYSDFAQYLNGDSSATTPGSKISFYDGFHGLEQNIYRQGQALLHVQDLIQQLSDRQNQQQEQLQQHKNLILSTLRGSDDFDVDQFLAGYPLGSGIDAKSPETKRKHIEEVDEEVSSKRKK